MFWASNLKKFNIKKIYLKKKKINKIKKIIKKKKPLNVKTYYTHNSLEKHVNLDENG
jgi:hypothetical protein